MVTGNSSVGRGQRHATRWSKLSDNVLEQALDRSLEDKGTKEGLGKTRGQRVQV